MQEDELEKKRKELELSLANERMISDNGKYLLIKKIMDVLEESMEDDKRFDDDWKQEAPCFLPKTGGF